jgi:competence protein ComEA
MKWTRRDRIGIITLASLIILVFLLPHYYHPWTKRKYPADTAWIAAIRKLEIKEDSDDYKVRAAETFYFDPNKTSFHEWKRLGIAERTIRTIQKYLSKGGKFRKAEDLKKIYGFQSDDYERLEPFVRIETKTEVVFIEKTYPKYEKPAAKTIVIEINLADTSAFISLPGIGSKLASRIVNFREKLGGFYSVEQVGETFGLADSTFQKIKKYLKLEISAVKKININTASNDELKAHPYIRWNLAKAIIAYRNEHGLFKGLEELKNIMAITNEVYSKLEPYLEL